MLAAVAVSVLLTLHFSTAATTSSSTLSSSHRSILPSHHHHSKTSQQSVLCPPQATADTGIGGGCAWATDNYHERLRYVGLPLACLVMGGGEGESGGEGRGGEESALGLPWWLLSVLS